VQNEAHEAEIRPGKVEDDSNFVAIVKEKEAARSVSTAVNQRVGSLIHLPGSGPVNFDLPSIRFFR
jgi:hypothetical protein